MKRRREEEGRDELTVADCLDVLRAVGIREEDMQRVKRLGSADAYFEARMREYAAEWGGCRALWNKVESEGLGYFCTGYTAIPVPFEVFQKFEGECVCEHRSCAGKSGCFDCFPEGEGDGQEPVSPCRYAHPETYFDGVDMNTLESIVKDVKASVHHATFGDWLSALKDTDATSFAAATRRVIRGGRVLPKTRCEQRAVVYETLHGRLRQVRENIEDADDVH